MSSLLLNDKPLVVIPSLAVAVGLDESIVLQQLHYWLLRSTNERDGRKWVYNTTKEWAQQFPFWSEEVIKRIMRSLRDKEVVITARYNTMKIDRTLWYTIDYSKLDAIVSNAPMVVSNDPTNSVIPPDAIVSNDPTNNQRIPEITTPVVVVVDKTPGDVFKFFENNMPGSMTDFIAKALGELIDTYGPGEVHTAIEKALLANVRKLNYIEQILINRAAGKDKPQKEQRNYGSNRQANTSSRQYTASADEGYELPAKWR